MKKLLSLFLLATLFVGCKDDKDEIDPEKPLTDNLVEGQWDWVDDTNYKIRESRFFTNAFDSYSEVESETGATDPKHGTYTISKSHLYFDDYKLNYKIVADSLWLSNDEGWSRKYIKNTDIRLNENLVEGVWQWISSANSRYTELRFFTAQYDSYSEHKEDILSTEEVYGKYTIGKKYIHYRAGYKIEYKLSNDKLRLKDTYRKIEREYTRTSPPPSVEKQLKEYLTKLTFLGSQINYDYAEYGTYMSQTLTTGQVNPQYGAPYKHDWNFLETNRHPQWRRYYTDIALNGLEIIRLSKKHRLPHYQLIARSIILMSTLYTTDAFGDMPFIDDRSATPTYQTQEAIYEWMTKEVDDLLDLYQMPMTGSIEIYPTDKDDPIFQGHLKSWEAFTYGLKARIYLRKLPNLDASSSNCTIIINAVNEALKNWIEPQYKYVGGANEQNCPWGSYQPSINAWESRKNELNKAIPTRYFAIQILGITRSGVSADDPRAFEIMEKRMGPDSDPRTKFRFIASNGGMEASYNETHFPNLYQRDNKLNTELTSNTSYVPYMLTEELLLIKAEAQYWAGNKTGAYQTTLEAAKLNMQRHRVADSEQAAYFKNPKYLPEAGFNIGHLMRQKYMCMYLQPEQWTDMRRYKYSNNTNDIKYDNQIIYPYLERPLNLFQAHWSAPNQWVERLNYDPETDRYHKDERQRIGAYQNPEWLKKPMIWAK